MAHANLFYVLISLTQILAIRQEDAIGALLIKCAERCVIKILDKINVRR